MVDLSFKSILLFCWNAFVFCAILSTTILPLKTPVDLPEYIPL